MHTCVSVCVYVYEERERISVTLRRSPPQLKRVRVISACVCERVRAGTIPLISLYCVCLSAGAHRDTKTVYVYPERVRISVTLVTTAAQGCASDICITVRVRACVLVLFR
jgi:hypothetical protein